MSLNSHHSTCPIYAIQINQLTVMCTRPGVGTEAGGGGRDAVEGMEAGKTQ